MIKVMIISKGSGTRDLKLDKETTLSELMDIEFDDDKKNFQALVNNKSEKPHVKLNDGDVITISPTVFAGTDDSHTCVCEICGCYYDNNEDD